VEPDETSKQFEPIDPGSILRLEVIRLFLSNRYEDCEVIRCLDVKTGEACDVLFIPAMDPDTDEMHMTPTFAIPESSLEDQEFRYIPVTMLAKTNPANFKNN
jgi:hypothetical protein